jgi:alanine racemase
VTTKPCSFIEDDIGSCHVSEHTSEECDRWMTAPLSEAMELQRSLPNGILCIVARGTPADGDG